MVVIVIVSVVDFSKYFLLHLSPFLVSIFITLQGVGTLVGPPVSGALKDRFGTYDEAFYLGGGVMAAAAALMAASNAMLWSRRRRRTGRAS